jgi:hypothetical protein
MEPKASYTVSKLRYGKRAGNTKQTLWLLGKTTTFDPALCVLYLGGGDIRAVTLHFSAGHGHLHDKSPNSVKIPSRESGNISSITKSSRCQRFSHRDRSKRK